ncbi:hypothetical protein [Saccharopolyspora spinosa]|uniref:hypothetical protein n=1 Tax=Saccharopolyspora spinosa TaxID=60894 RepID=UPI000237AA53|nr:hypothetical protein [Saccharopolyspora spinosa]
MCGGRTGKIVFDQKFTNSQAAIEALIARARKKAGEVVWAAWVGPGPRERATAGPRRG